MNSNKLVSTVAAFAQTFRDIENDEAKLMGIRDRFIERAKSHLSELDSASETNPLREAGMRIQETVTGHFVNWAQEWDTRKVTRELSDRFGDKVIFLVFGKVNAGKSSFGNFIASVFDPADVQYFYLDDGEIHNTYETFCEGSTETTNRIQGVELGGKLVLLDSPGLHSVTDENGELARRFTDSADAVIWLTPSTSPGQVQELDDLKLELESEKPLLPIITRSDKVDEDEDEAGELVSVRVNKSTKNRTAQETDVQMRAQEKLGAGKEVRRPLSISVRAYESSDKGESELVASGIAGVLEAMAGLIDEASVYKPRKAWQQIINYLEQSVLLSLRVDLVPALGQLNELVAQQEQQLSQHRTTIQSRLRLELTEQVTDWAEELKERKDAEQLACRIRQYIAEAIAREAEHVVREFAGKVEQVMVNIDQTDIGEFSDIEIEYRQVSGRGGQAAVAAGAAVIAGVLASFVTGPLGIAVAGAVGSALGGAAGELLVDTKTMTESIGVDATAAIDNTLKRVDTKLPELIQATFKPWEEVLQEMQAGSAQLNDTIEQFRMELGQAKEDLSNGRV